MGCLLRKRCASLRSTGVRSLSGPTGRNSSFARPGEIYRGEVARRKHLEWADIPAVLVKRWTEERQQAKKLTPEAASEDSTFEDV
jgi:hypothetical protein